MLAPIDENRLKQLFDAAVGAQQRAYAPYSKFHVGAAILADDGHIYAGCNVENAAYPVGTCAEAGALAAMIAGGAKRIRTMVVSGDGKDLVTPCGACRQRIREFADAEVVVHIAGPQGIRQAFTLAELLPVSFGPAHLRQ